MFQALVVTSGEWDIAFAFSHVLNARDNSLWPALRLEELSDLGDSDLDSPAHLPANAPAKRSSKPWKRIRHKEVEANPGDAIEQCTDVGNTAMEHSLDHLEIAPDAPQIDDQQWDSDIDPVLQMDQVRPTNGRSPSPHAATSTGPIPPLHASGIPTSLNITDMGIDVIPIDKTDAIYSGHLAQVERGVQFMNGPIPHWIQDHVVHTSPVPVRQPAMCRGNGQSTNGGAAPVPPATSDAILRNPQS